MTNQDAGNNGATGWQNSDRLRVIDMALQSRGHDSLPDFVEKHREQGWQQIVVAIAIATEGAERCSAATLKRGFQE